MTAGLLMMTSFPVFAADSSSDPSGKSQPVTEGSTFDDGTLTYTILKNMQVSVTGCITTATNISIMPKIDDKECTGHHCCSICSPQRVL